MHTDGNFAWRREQIDGGCASSPPLRMRCREPRPTAKRLPGSRFDPGTLAGLLDTSRLTAAGHSFGGATVLAALSSSRRVKRAVLLDPGRCPSALSRNRRPQRRPGAPAEGRGKGGRADVRDELARVG